MSDTTADNIKAAIGDILRVAHSTSKLVVSPYSHVARHSNNPSHGREQQLAGEALLSFIDYNMLHQVVNTLTRDRNILEIFLANNERLIRNVSAQDTPLSDHRVVFINLFTDLKSQNPPSPIPTFEDQAL